MRRAPLALGLLLLVAGGALVGAGDATAVKAIGMALLGLGGVLVVALAFLAVGESEDRERRARR